MAGDLESASARPPRRVRIFEQEKDLPRLAGALVLRRRDRLAGAQSDASGPWRRAGPRRSPASIGDTASLQRLLLAGRHAVEPGGRVRAGQRLPGGGGPARPPAQERWPRGRHAARRTAGRRPGQPRRAPSSRSPRRSSRSRRSARRSSRRCSRTDANGHLLPSLCERWERRRSRRGRCVLTLRADVQFSDGTPLTAGGVKPSIETSIRSAATCPRPSPRFAASPSCGAGTAGDLAGIVAARRARARDPARRAAADLSGAADRREHGDRPVRGRAISRRRADRYRTRSLVVLSTPAAWSSSAIRRYWRAGLPAARRDRVPPSLTAVGHRRRLPRRRDRPGARPAAGGSRRDPARRALPAGARRDAEEEHLLRPVQLPDRGPVPATWPCAGTLGRRPAARSGLADAGPLRGAGHGPDPARACSATTRAAAGPRCSRERGRSTTLRARAAETGRPPA